jgi:hypothetical protein
VVWFKLKKGGQPQVWFGPNQKKEVNHIYGLVQIRKRRQTTGVDGSKLEKGGQPHLWFGPNQKKEANHRGDFVQNGSWRATTVVVGSKSIFIDVS